MTRQTDAETNQNSNPVGGATDRGHLSRRGTLAAIGGVAVGLTAVGVVSGDFADGDGSEGSPYQIETWEQLDTVRDYRDDHFELAADLNEGTAGYDTHASENANDDEGWNPIPNFEGSLDGQGYAISGLYIERTGTGDDNIGLFEELEPGAEVRNLRLVDADVTGNTRVGALVGDASTGSEITNCGVHGEVEAADDDNAVYSGGLVGDNSASITDSYFRGIVRGWFWVGGLAGNNEGKIVRSYARGTGVEDMLIAADRSEIGGIAGENEGTIEECYAVGRVDGSESGITNNAVGGIAGKNSGEEAIVTNSYARGFVNNASDPDGYLGGLVGENLEDATVERSYFEGDIGGSGDMEGKVAGLNEGDVEDVYYVSDNGAFGEDDGTADVTDLHPDEIEGDAATDNMTTLDFAETWATVTANPPTLQVHQLDPIGPFDSPPQDLTNNGYLNDVNGDGEATVVDVQALDQHRDDEVVTDNPEWFAFAREDPTEVSQDDVEALFEQVSAGGDN